MLCVRAMSGNVVAHLEAPRRADEERRLPSVSTVLRTRSQTRHMGLAYMPPHSPQVNHPNVGKYELYRIRVLAGSCLLAAAFQT